jgi:hypothetical protein
MGQVGRVATSGQRAHAVVLGAGMAGLLAARVLASHFEQVTVVDRDRLPEHPRFRPGVPQSRHLHVLLGRGLECLEQLFPGFEADLVAVGAPVVEGSESLWLNAAGWSRRYQSPIRLLGASRELVEWQARTRVMALDQVQVLEGCEAVGLLTDPSRDAVTGVRLRSRDGRAVATSPATEVAADLVVDASGRFSRAPQWLAALGYPAPGETSINPLLGYASRQYAIPAGFEVDWRMLVINAKPPGNARSGALVPIEGGRWMVALIGAGRDYPPTDDAGFLEFARGLRSPLLYETVKGDAPIPTRSVAPGGPSDRWPGPTPAPGPWPRPRTCATPGPRAHGWTYPPGSCTATPTGSSRSPTATPRSTRPSSTSSTSGIPRPPSSIPGSSSRSWPVTEPHRSPTHRPPPGSCCTDLTDGPRPGPASWQMERRPDAFSGKEPAWPSGTLAVDGDCVGPHRRHRPARHDHQLGRRHLRQPSPRTGRAPS